MVASVAELRDGDRVGEYRVDRKGKRRGWVRDGYWSILPLHTAFGFAGHPPIAVIRNDGEEQDPWT